MVVPACGDTGGPPSDGQSQPPTVTSVMVTPANVTLTALGDTTTLAASARTASGTVLSGKTFGWATSDDQVATVTANRGLATAVGNGTATITATTDGVQGSASVTVQQEVAGVRVTPAAAALVVAGETVQLAAAVEDANGAGIIGKTPTWASLNPNIVTIDGSGVVTAVASGQATVAASVEGVTAYGLLNVAIPGATPVSTWSAMSSGTTEWLFGVWATGPSDVFAAGDVGTIVHFDGSAWSAMASGVTTWFHRVWGTGPGDIYAVGTFGTIVRYDGSDWTSVASGTSTSLRGLWGSSPVDVFAVGGSTILHYDGTGWSETPSPVPYYLNDIWGASPADVFAVGNIGTILRYDGADWTVMQSGTTTELIAVWGTSSTDVYAVGALGAVLQYDGTGWSPMTNTPTEDLFAVGGTSASDMYAAGKTIWHFDGAVWSAQLCAPCTNMKEIFATSNDVFVVGSDGVIVRGTR